MKRDSPHIDRARLFKGALVQDNLGGRQEQVETAVERCLQEDLKSNMKRSQRKNDRRHQDLRSHAQKQSSDVLCRV